ncbi:MAG: hypothetical protein K2N67_01135 [Mucispirillum sp.]|nr:hypothetical protein [Mucispirillum sp.]
MAKRVFHAVLYAAAISALWGCAGSFFTGSPLERQYEAGVKNEDLRVYFNKNEKELKIAVQNMSNVFMENLSIVLRCSMDGNYLTGIYDLKNLKTYYHKEITAAMEYAKCSRIVMKYIYTPRSDGGFAYEDRRGFYFNVPDIPQEGILILK